MSAIYTIESSDPHWAGRKVVIRESWSRSLLLWLQEVGEDGKRKEEGEEVLLVHPWLANDVRNLRDAERYARRYTEGPAVVGKVVKVREKEAAR